MNEISRGYNKLIMISLVILCVGIGVGSIYLMNTGVENIEHIKEYLSSMFSGFGENIKRNQILKNALIENLLLALFIFVSGFFKFCTPAVAFCIARKGFIMGFTSASVLRSFGLKGLFINMAYLPTIVISIPAFLFFSSISVKNACCDVGERKSFMISYIIIAVIVSLLLCASAFFEAYITTSLIKFMAQRL